MNIGILADIHANHIALDTCIEDAKKFNITKWIIAGDVMGRLPGINETFALLDKLDATYLVGNHEELFCKHYNPSRPLECMQYQHRVITPLNAQRVKDLVASRAIVFQSDEPGLDDIICTHSNFHFPYAWETYIDSKVEALWDIGAFANYGENKKLGIVGHTHIPLIVQADDAAQSATCLKDCYSTTQVSYASGKTYVVAPSVGMTRDTNPETGYVVIDTNAKLVTVRRIPYDIDALFSFARNCEGFKLANLYNLDLYRLSFTV